MPVQDRPELIYIYVPDLDEVGHLHWPESSHLNDALKQMDMFAAALDKSLRDRNLSDIVDVVYVSDHGMSSSNDHRIIYLDEILGREDFLKLFSTDGPSDSAYSLIQNVGNWLLKRQMIGFGGLSF